MKSSRIVALASIVLTASATPLLAKRGTIGIYAIVDHVAFEPNETSPERVRICGVFVVPVPMSSGQYKAPQRGCLHFRMAPGMERIAEHDWRDLNAVAGTGQVVGFAQYWVPNHADRSGNPHHRWKSTCAMTRMRSRRTCILCRMNGELSEPATQPTLILSASRRSSSELRREIDCDSVQPRGY